ncbi:DJ-1 family glyoxalase III [Coraliomargarita parva]|uniref:DJ-1 family glyoxalase III n=1 Tax=Coraliomargarita parva TaxID=3014050 RepID=UPI0022B48789|nr:DJ-1 family glyoxalase III [Coraliomargarita parva]
MKNRVVCLLHPGFEEIEAVTPIDLLSRAGIEVVLASVDDSKMVQGRSGLELASNCGLSDVASQSFDAVFLPGGPGIQKIRKHDVICDLFRRHHQEGKWLACICAAPLLLLDAGLRDGLSLACHPSAEPELGPVETTPVVVSGQILTSRGAGTATEFGLELVRRLADDATAESIAASICWPHPTR